MSNKPILITGCQRSGTTLTHLVLNSHPAIHSIDELAFDHADLNTYLSAPNLPGFVSFKLPRYAQMLSFIETLPDARVLWCVRNPLDVVSSMVKLGQLLSEDGPLISWAAHPYCAPREILNSYWPLEVGQKQKVSHFMKEYERIIHKDLATRSRNELIFTGALCWRIKSEIPDLYRKRSIKFHILEYEQLVASPEQTIRRILQYIGVPWDSKVLHHHEVHDGISVGATDNSRPIDTRSVGQGADTFSAKEQAIVAKICGSNARKFGYDLD